MVACAGHLAPAEWAVCQEARSRTRAEYAARLAEELAARKERGEEAQPEAIVAQYVPRQCTGQCISQERAWGREADSASCLCATCDGYVCVACGQAEVESILEFCGRCEVYEASPQDEPDTMPDEVGTGAPLPMRLTAMVNELVAATGHTHRYVNACINRTIGVTTRVGADVQVIRRAVRAARDWLDRLAGEPGTAVPLSGSAAHTPGRALPSKPVDATPHPTDDVGELAELTVTGRLTGQSAAHLCRCTAIQQRPVEEVAAECIGDEMCRGVCDALYSGCETYAAALEGLAKRLALIVRELGALPSGVAAKVIALAAAEKHGPLPDEWQKHMLEQLTDLWTGCTTEFGERPDGSVGPVEDTKIHALVTPAQWDALARIGAPGSLTHGTHKALEAGITALDH
ncbi:hypothetical protein QZH56_36710 [Streptomyces olivoreticuli]|uniref:hypothetical protein n=1 Tax=Streptomyces olivoreticuli TaxID=68246 RepID=UPI00265A8552|nr:hypothetical protein [Streptomyces olivoreticuli]WKK24120.1 hypothetical protein QZH56_36710 [Streptomyces olivoreticuli]